MRQEHVSITRADADTFVDLLDQDIQSLDDYLGAHGDTGIAPTWHEKVADLRKVRARVKAAIRKDYSYVDG